MLTLRRHLLTLLLLLSALFPISAAGHVEGDKDHSPSVTSAPEGGGSVGLNERLGAKLPLSLVFRDERGEAVRLADLVTGPTIILPVYYGCTNVCNYLQGGMAKVIPALKPKAGTDYRIISLSIDETETAQAASRSKRMHLDSIKVPFPADGWRFLTGDAKSIRSLTDAAGYNFQRRGRDFAHPVASLVVTRDGMIVRYLYGTNFLAKDVSLALMEARDGNVGATVRKVVGYCFSFDPAQRGYQFNLLRVSATVIVLCCGGFLTFLLLTGRNYRQKDKGNG